MTEEDFKFGEEDDELSLLETLDHVLDLGLVIAGEITISVAGIDLIYVGLNVLLGSVESIQETLDKRTIEGESPNVESPTSNVTSPKSEA